MLSAAHALVALGFYPLWLLAGLLDYVCHGRTRLEHTSGISESVLHVLQFACILVLVALLPLFVVHGVVLAGLCLLLLLHTLSSSRCPSWL